MNLDAAWWTQVFANVIGDLVGALVGAMLGIPAGLALDRWNEKMRLRKDVQNVLLSLLQEVQAARDGLKERDGPGSLPMWRPPSAVWEGIQGTPAVGVLTDTVRRQLGEVHEEFAFVRRMHDAIWMLAMQGSTAQRGVDALLGAWRARVDVAMVKASQAIEVLETHRREAQPRPRGVTAS